MITNQRLEDKKLWIESVIVPYLECHDGYNDLLVKAMNYSFKAGGKRLRPMLIAGVYELLCPKGQATKDITPYMAAIEMIHTSSLIHDDLPAMDDDDLRRGIPTCHKVYGEGTAVLAGDALINLAYEVLFEAIENTCNGFDIKAAFALAKGAGIRGMMGGQMVDILYENQPMTPDVLDYIHSHKTGGLITGCFLCGGYLAEADADTLAHLKRLGEALGLAFQIQDDLLDHLGTQENLGKPVHSDDKNHKMTYVHVYGIENSQSKVKALLDEVLEGIEALNVSGSDFMTILIAFLMHREF